MRAAPSRHPGVWTDTSTPQAAAAPTLMKASPLFGASPTCRSDTRRPALTSCRATTYPSPALFPFPATTITGSIGVYGVLPTFSRPLAKLGIHTDGVGTTPLAGTLRLDRPLDTDLRRIFQHATEKTYEDFIQLVAEARQMDPEAVDEVAQGRVWSGSQAKDRGLVDQTGTLKQSIDSAARIAGLGTDYVAVYDERELTAFETFLIEMTGSAMAKLGVGLSGLETLRSTLLEDLLADLRILSRSANGFSVAAHCLCRVD